VQPIAPGIEAEGRISVRAPKSPLPAKHTVTRPAIRPVKYLSNSTKSYLVPYETTVLINLSSGGNHEKKYSYFKIIGIRDRLIEKKP
jgi:hypothetical protein